MLTHFYSTHYFTLIKDTVFILDTIAYWHQAKFLKKFQDKNVNQCKPAYRVKL